MKAATSGNKKKRGKTAYIQMTHKELINRLTARNLPPRMVATIAERVREKKEVLRIDSRAKSRHRFVWQDVIAPLLKEQSSVAARLTRMRKNNNTEQLAVYEPYAGVLSKCLGLLRTYQKAGTRPPQEEYAFKNNVLDKNRAGHIIPLGLAWVDWVPVHIQAAIKQEHIKLQKPHTRTLLPLFRRDEDIKRGFMKQHEQVKSAWRTEMNYLRDTIDHAPAGTRGYEERQLACMCIAMEKANAVPPTKRLQPAWSKYVSAKERETVFREAHPSWQQRVSALAADETPVGWE